MVPNPIIYYKYQQLQQYLFFQRLLLLILVCKLIEKLSSQASDPTQSLPTKLPGKYITQENKAENFSYDPVGNRLTGPDYNDAYNYNTGNQLTSDRKHQYEYDQNGNLIKKTETGDDGKAKVWTYAYDYENRLGSVVKQESEKTVTFTFKYDPFGRRLEKKVTTTPSPLAGEGGGETKTYAYVYDNEDIILEYLTKTEDGKTKTEATKYVHGPGIDEPLAIERKGEVYFYHADGLGSITALTDKKQKVVESYTYSAFGEVKRKGDKVKNTYTFTAREWDEEIGVYSLRARYYDPKLARFIAFDPILHPVSAQQGSTKGCRGSSNPLFNNLLKNPKNLNQFSYTGNNPINYKDPSGLLMLPDLGAIMQFLNCMTTCVRNEMSKPYGTYGLNDLGNDPGTWGNNLGSAIGRCKDQCYPPEGLCTEVNIQMSPQAQGQMATVMVTVGTVTLIVLLAPAGI